MQTPNMRNVNRRLARGAARLAEAPKVVKDSVGSAWCSVSESEETTVDGRPARRKGVEKGAD